MVSSELPEILAVCDRVAVFRAGRIVEFVESHMASEEALLKLAIGEIA